MTMNAAAFLARRTFGLQSPKPCNSRPQYRDARTSDAPWARPAKGRASWDALWTAPNQKDHRPPNSCCLRNNTRQENEYLRAMYFT